MNIGIESLVPLLFSWLLYVLNMFLVCSPYCFKGEQSHLFRVAESFLMNVYRWLLLNPACIEMISQGLSFVHYSLNCIN